LLIEWRRAQDDQWWGRVLMAQQRDGRVTASDCWVPAEHLKPHLG
jgi:hypothetical protein